MLLGQDDELPRALTTLSTFGLLRDQTADALREWISAAVAADLIVVSNNQYRTLSLTTRGREFMHGRADDVSVRRPPRTSPWSPSRRARDDYRDLLDEFRLGRTRRFRSRRRVRLGRHLRRRWRTAKSVDGVALRHRLCDPFLPLVAA